MRDTDLEFPACCTRCPHLKPVKTSCTHELRQSLVHELGSDRPCPVYVEQETSAMERPSGQG